MKNTLGYLILALAFGAMSVSAQWKPWNDLPPHCSHIIVLRGEQDRHLADGVMFGDQVQLLSPGPRVLAATREALERMTPFLCRSIRRLAFGRYTAERDKTGAVNSFGAGDLVLINLAHSRFYEEDLDKPSSRLMLQETLIHEAVHSAETLLGAESKDGGPKAGGKSYGGSWDLAARNLARQIIASTRLETGLYKEWDRLHRSFSEHGWALRYDNASDMATVTKDEPTPKRWRGVTHTKIAEAGFMNHYGARNWAEDMAAFAANLYIGPEMAAGIASLNLSEDYRQDAACRELQAQKDKNVPGKLAAVYAKLRFLQDLGFVTEEAVAKCTGTGFGLLEVGGEGFFIFEKGDLRQNFENKVEAGMGSKGIGNVFEMRAEGQASFAGKAYPASMKLSLAVGIGPIERASWPRGFYKLALIGPNNLSLRLDGARAGNFDAKDAFVLVGSSSGKFISGSIFLTQAWRPEAPIPVPQVFDPPLHIRFQLKK